MDRLKNRRLRNIKIVILFALCFGLICAGLLIFANSRKTHKPKYTGPVENVSTGIVSEYAGLILIAENQGYFRDNGLNVTTKEYASGPVALNDLLSGKLDMAVASDFAGVRNSFANQNFKILANMSKSEAFYLVANNERGIKDVSNLKGKKIGITQETVGEFFLSQFLILNNLSVRDVKLVNLPQSNLVKAVGTGQIDAAVLFEPNAYQAQAALGDKAVRMSIQSGRTIYSLLYGTDKLVNERPEVIVRYMQAIIEAEKFIKKHDTEARNIVKQRLHYDDAYINYIWPKFSFEATLDQELLLNLDDEARWVIDNHLSTASKPPNYLHMIYFNGLEVAKPEGISIIR